MEMAAGKLKELELIESELIRAVQSAGATLNELSKDKPLVKQIEQNATQYVKSLEIVEQQLSEKIQYLTKVSTGHAHEGSAYASAKVLNLAATRLEHAKAGLAELDSAARVSHPASSAGPLDATPHAPPSSDAATDEPRN